MKPSAAKCQRCGLTNCSCIGGYGGPLRPSAASTWVCSPHGTRVVQEDEPKFDCAEADRSPCTWERVPTAAPNRSEFLLVLTFRVDEVRMEATVKAALGAAVDQLVRYTDSEANVYAKPVDDLVAADLDALAALIGWDAVSRLRVGDVVAVGFQHPFGDAATREGAGSAATNDPRHAREEVERVAGEDVRFYGR